MTTDILKIEIKTIMAYCEQAMKEIESEKDFFYADQSLKAIRDKSKLLYKEFSWYDSFKSDPDQFALR